MMVQSLDLAENTVSNGLYVNNGGYYRPPKAVMGGSAYLVQGVVPPNLSDKYSLAFYFKISTPRGMCCLQLQPLYDRLVILSTDA